jgi:branched-subunit amino acid aminotransferase/4-amino-4-deoxychorismate lyase
LSSYLNYNGNVLSADQPVLMAANRAFRYGDAVFETIRLMHGELLYFEKHLQRLKKSMHLMGMKWRSDFTFHNLYLLMRHLDQTNELKGNGRIRLEVFRNDGGRYAPVSNDVSFLIEAEAVSEKNYLLNENPLRIEVFNDITKSKNKFSNIKSSNALIFVMAGIHKEASGLDDCILLNNDGKICEAIASNIFLISKDEIYTPALSEGCIDGVMRHEVIETFKKHNRKTHEVSLTTDHVLKSDEILLTNVIDGIRWVGAFRQKRYFNGTAKWLLSELNEAQTKKV